MALFRATKSMALVSYPLIRVLILTGIKPDTYQSVKPINYGCG